MYLKPAFYNRTMNKLADLYPFPGMVKEAVTRLGFPEKGLNFTGTGLNMWDSVVSYADRNDRQMELIELGLEKDDKDPDLLALQNAIQDGSAFITKISYDVFIQGNAPGSPVHIFLIYDKRDDELVNMLKQQLRILELNKTVILLDMIDDALGTSDKQKTWLEVEGKSDIILLLLTPAFFNNDDCMPLAFSGYDMGKRIVPVLMAECPYSRIHAFDKLVPLPTDGKFVSECEKKGKVLVEIVEGIEKIIKYLKSTHGRN